MSVFEKCLALGLELRNSQQGQDILSYKAKLDKMKSELYLFNTLVNKNYISEHFFAPIYALNQIQGNKANEDPLIQAEIKRIESLVEVEQFAKACIPFGKMCNNISSWSVGNTVMYSMPDNMSASPHAVRLLNTITVECLHLPLVKHVIQKASTDQEFLKMATAFDAHFSNHQLSPYTQSDRNILRKLVLSGFPKECVEEMYSFLCLLTYIKAMIFDAFFDNIFLIDENSDIDKSREYQLTNARYVTYKLKPEFIISNTGWFLKVIHRDGSVSFGQLLNKHICIQNQNKALEGITIQALLFDNVK